ncbi:hypothetical protein GCM10009827_041810 [Dactylosporangium maewongense]|uniref:Uncharacterized protein n=1 Tax=Dactylosporangium maewongense TaxID=634393 RepID=A0ABP4LG73_9ACTN
MDERLVGGDGLADLGDARRVRQGEIFTGRERDAGLDGHLAALMEVENWPFKGVIGHGCRHGGSFATSDNAGVSAKRMGGESAHDAIQRG